MSNQKKQYDQEFKDRAVRLVLDKGKTASEVSRDLGISPNLLSIWKRNYLLQSKGITNDIVHNDLDSAQKRIRELENELLIAKEERDILKKAVSFFAKN